MKLDYSAFNSPVTVADQAAYFRWRSANAPGSSLLNRELSLKALAVSILSLVGLFAMSIGLVTMIRNISALSETFLGVTYVLLPTSIMFVLVIVFARRWSASLSEESVMRYKFAKQNGLQYSEDMADPPYKGILFGRGSLRRLMHAYTFSDGTLIGNYRYYDQSGRYEELREWGIASVPLPRRLPHMLLDSRTNNLFGGMLSNLPSDFQGEALSLEGDFDKYFRLYVPNGYERDALYIFTPDVMAAVVDFGQAYDIEIVDDRLMIYVEGPLDLIYPDTISRLMYVIDTIRREISHQADRYSDERGVVSGPYSIPSPGGNRTENVNIEA